MKHEGAYTGFFQGEAQTLLNSVTLPKKAWEKINIFHMLRCNAVAVS